MPGSHRFGMPEMQQMSLDAMIQKGSAVRRAGFRSLKRVIRKCVLTLLHAVRFVSDFIDTVGCLDWVKPVVRTTGYHIDSLSRSLGVPTKKVRLTGLGACLGFLCLIGVGWSLASQPKSKAVMLSFPEKPTRSNHIILEWPGAEDPRIRNMAISHMEKSRSYQAGSEIALPPGRGERLAALTWLADIEAIEGIGTFTRAVRAVGLETLIEPGRRYTWFAPDDVAFRELGKDELDVLFSPNGHALLRTLLRHHIIEDHLQFDDFIDRSATYLSLANKEITIEGADVVKVGIRSLVASDFPAANTIVHVIDGVLPPG